MKKDKFSQDLADGGLEESKMAKSNYMLHEFYFATLTDNLDSENFKSRNHSFEVVCED